MQNRKKRGLLTCLVLFSILTIMLVVPASAAAVTDIPADSVGDSMMKGYELIRNVSAALATVGIAFSGIMMLIGSDKAAEQARTSIRNCILALIGILILPLIVTFGKTLLS